MADLTYRRIKHIKSGRTAIIVKQNEASVRVKFDDGLRDEGNGVNGEQTIPRANLDRQWAQWEGKQS
jgi:hypothetical protein